MSKKILLLVDDVELFLQLGKSMLEREEFEIHTAKGGVEALKMTLELVPDLVLLDFHMPDMDGDAVCRKLKDNNDTYQIPVIMLTTEEDEDARVRCLKSGCDDFIAKPFKWDVLNHTVEKHLTIRARRHGRANVTIPCTLLRGDQQTDSTIHSLSPYGVFVELDLPPIPGTSYLISFSLPGSREVMTVGALARWNRKLTPEMPTGSGFEFDGADRETFEWVSDHVNKILSLET